MTAPVRHRIGRPRFLTFLAGIANLTGVLTASIAIAWAVRRSEMDLSAGEARVAGLIAACGIAGIIASHGLLRLRSDARSLQMILSSIWLAGWAVAALRGAGSGLVAAMTPGAILAIASVVYLSRESIGHVFATAPSETGGRGLLIGDVVAVAFILLFVYPKLRNPAPPPTPEVTFDQATALYRGDQYAAAIPLFEEFLKARKNHALGYARLGTSLAQVGRYGEAATALRRATEIDTADYQSRNNLALTYDKMGKPELGIEVAREAVRLKGDNAIVHNTLGYLLLRAGHAREAIDPLLTAARIDPRYREVRHHLATAYQQTGQRSRARAEIAALRTLDSAAADTLEKELQLNR